MCKTREMKKGPDGLLVLTIPIQMRRVAGRKMVIMQDGNAEAGDSEDIPGPRAARGEMERKGRKERKSQKDLDAQEGSAARALRDEAVRTALAVRWVRLLEDGTFDSMAGLARAVSVDPSLIARMVRRADGKGWV